MATKTYIGLKDILIAKLTALQGVSGSLFVQVAGSNITEPDGYPLCYVMERKGGGKIVDTHRNERTWEFSVVIHYALGAQTEEAMNTANNALLDAVDRTIAMFDQDPMLKDSNGFEQCKKVEVTPVEIERATQDVAVIRALLNVKVFDLVNRYA